MSGWLAPRSLRTRLLALVLGAILLACGLLAATAYRGALSEADALFDDHLRQMARSVQQGVPLGWLAPDVDDDGVDIHVQIWGPDGVQIFRSPRSVLPPRAVLGFSDMEVGGRRYRVYSIQTPLQTVQIAQDLSAREARARELAWRAVLPLLAVVPFLLLAVGWIISRSLAPVQRMQRQVAARQASDLSPLPEQGLPDEVRPLVAELNGLFARVRSAFQAQKDFVADAAHELRTPLTALRLQVQALQRAPDRMEREAALQRLREGIDRSIELAHQLLVLARQEAEAAAASVPQPVDLLALTREVVGELMPLAQGRQIDLGLEQGAGLCVTGHAEALQTLLRNLLDNAIKYSPTPGRVDVSVLQEDDGGVRWCVEDSGPGIPETERERVFDRFRRGSDTQGQAGSGLGLAIVQAVARQHGARVLLGRSSRLGGLQVSVCFPRQTPQPLSPA
ncbi:MAG: sensor histidine kinase N-terminal domain-containing protein [Curvibacter sp.]|nr:sensor histidine kinase N-terminal domain-containing protein [Curvibacter sp.]